MIDAFHKLNGNTETLPGRTYGKCYICQARIEWVVTDAGKKMMLAPNTGEPHIPHCGKHKWTRKQWTELLDEYIAKENEVNRIPVMTVPDKNSYRVVKGKEAQKLIDKFGSSPVNYDDLPW